MVFLRSIIGICRGPYISKEFPKHSWGRTIWHLFLICFFTSLFIGIGNYLMLNYRWRAASMDFNNIFGYRLMRSRWCFVSEKQPKVSRTQELPYNSLLIYVSPEGSDKVEADAILKERNVVVLWSPAVLAFFSRSEEGSWTIFYVQPNGEKYYLWKDDFSGMKKEVDRLASIRLNEEEQKEIYSQMKPWISSRKLFIYIRAWYAAIVALRYFLYSFIGILIVTLVFSALFKLFTGERSSAMPLGSLWKISIYTAFPILLVLSFFPAMQFPGVAYFYDLLIVGWAVYLFVVLKYLAENPDELEEDENGENNEPVL